MGQDFVNECYATVKEINLIAGALNELGNNFRACGNTNIANSLWDKADSLNDLAERVKSICSDRVNSDLEQSQKMTGAVLTAMLAKK